MTGLDHVFLKSALLAMWRMNWKGLERMLGDHLERYSYCPGEKQDNGQTKVVVMVETEVKRFETFRR